MAWTWWVRTGRLKTFLADIDIKSYRDKLSGTTSFRSSLKIVHRSVGDVPIDPGWFFDGSHWFHFWRSGD